MTIQDWYKILEQKPLDWDTRLVFSDWLLENDNSRLAKSQRWQVRHKKCPFLFPNSGIWYCYGIDLKTGFEKCCSLKPRFFTRLGGKGFCIRMDFSESSGSYYRVGYSSLQLAESNLALVLGGYKR